ncbi:MAG: NAD-dependent epimerase/dehydratase family protein [Planctomycetales bacterium]|nr:NAD-dependent epimerase/dehydratase family protein [Planctomycetales bacterium]
MTTASTRRAEPGQSTDSMAQSLRGMAVLVTGATGLVGNNVTRQLIDHGAHVRCLVRSASRPRPLEELDVELVVGDVCDESSVMRAMREQQVVVHAAGDVAIGWSRCRQAKCVNTEGTRLVATGARRLNARMIHISTVNTMSVGGDQVVADEETPWSGREVASNYVSSKRRAEELVREQLGKGLDAVVLCPGFMLGPWDWKPSSGQMFLAVATRFSGLAPGGRCSVCDVRDVSQGICRSIVAAESGRRYILAGENMSYLTLWQAMAAATNGYRPVGCLGPVGSLIVGRAGDLWGQLRGAEPTINSASMAMASQYHYYDSSRAVRDLGYHVRPLQQTLADAWEWFCRFGYGPEKLRQAA